VFKIAQISVQPGKYPTAVQMLFAVEQSWTSTKDKSHYPSSKASEKI